MSLVRRVVSSTSYLFVGSLAERVFSMLAAILLARVAGPAHLGAFAFAFACIGLLGTFVDLGSKSIINRDISREPSKSRTLVPAGIHLRLLVSVLLVVGVHLAVPFLPYPAVTRDLLRLGSLALLLSFSSVFVCLFEVNLRMGWPSLIGAASAALKVAAFWVVAVVWPDIRAFVVAGLLVSTLSVAAMAGLVRKEISIAAPLRPDLWGYLTRESWPLLLAGLCTAAYLRVDQIMLYPILGDVQAGYYSTAVRVAEMVRVLPSTLMISLAPVLCRDAVGPEGNLKRSYSMSIKLIGVTMLGLILVIQSAGAPLIRLLYGDAYLPAVQPLLTLAIAEFFVALQIVDYTAVIAVNRQRVLFHAGVTAAVLNVVLNLVFIPRWGMLGAALASVVSYASTTVVIFINRDTRRFVVYQAQQMGRPLLAAALAWGAGTILAPVPAFGVGIVLPIELTVYVAALFAFRVLGTTDLELLRRVWTDRTATSSPTPP